MKGKDFSRRAVLGGLLAGVGQTAFASPPVTSLLPVLRPGSAPVVIAQAAAMIKAAGLRGKISYVVADARTGQVLEAINPILGLPPASVAKTITAQYALSALGAEHRFVTRLLAVGSITGGRLNGDLVLQGGGDPTLDTTALAEMAQALKNTGLREITGRFLVQSGTVPRVARIDAGQPDHLAYNPAVSGLNLNFNRVHFQWKKVKDDYTVIMDARTVGYRPAVAMASMKVVDRKSPIYTYSNGGQYERWTVARAALGKGGNRWLPVRQPELYAGDVFQTLARSHGIVLKQPVLDKGVADGSALVQRQSSTLGVILQEMLDHSTNLTAEVTGLGASLARGRPVSDLRQSAQEMSSWMNTQMGARRARFVDHSGLGDNSRISASDMVAGLVSMGADSQLAGILKQVNPRDGKGNLLLGSERELRAKTGTLNFVSGLAGFMKTGPEQELAFAIFSADLPRRNALAPADRERPAGARGWGRRARALQWGLLDRWANTYG